MSSAGICLFQACSRSTGSPDQSSDSGGPFVEGVLFSLELPSSSGILDHLMSCDPGSSEGEEKGWRENSVKLES